MNPKYRAVEFHGQFRVQRNSVEYYFGWIYMREREVWGTLVRPPFDTLAQAKKWIKDELRGPIIHEVTL